MKLKNILQLEFDPHRVFGLDILRALAISFVVIEHGLVLIPENAARIVRYGMLDGVSIFFVLSGFLIGTILLRLLEKQKPTFPVLLGFWSRRWFRTLPNYFLVLILLIIIHMLFQPGFKLGMTGPYFVFLQNFRTPHPHFFSEAWSLSVEEWFYLLIPAFLFFAVRFLRLPSRKAILLIACSIIIVSIGIRYWRYTNVTDFNIMVWGEIFRKQVITRLDSIMFGVIGAYLFLYRTAFWDRHRLLFLFAGILILVSDKIPVKLTPMPYDLYMCVFSFIKTSVGALLLLPFLSRYRREKGMLYKTVTYVSLTSYSMYLINYSLVRIWIIRNTYGFDSESALEMLAKNAIYYGIVIVGSILLYKYYEKPFMKLREKLPDRLVR